MLLRAGAPKLKSRNEVTYEPTRRKDGEKRNGDTCKMIEENHKVIIQHDQLRKLQANKTHKWGKSNGDK